MDIGCIFMALPKPFLLFILFLALIFSIQGGGAQVEPQLDESPKVVTALDASDSSAIIIELDQLKSKIRTLESQISEKSQEVKNKDGILAEKEKIIQDRLGGIESLQKEIGSLERKGTLDAEEQVGKAHARAHELQRQVDKLKGELEKQNKEKLALEVRVTEAEKQIRHLNSKLEDLQKINEGQKEKIRKTKGALRVAEEEMMKAKFEATSRRKEQTEVHGAWLLPWLAVHFIHSKSFIETHWNEHGKPALEVLTKKALEKEEQVGKWVEPHMKTIKTKWIPAVKIQWSVLKTRAEPHMQLLTSKTVEVYEASKNAMSPHLNRALEYIDLCYQEAKRFSKPSYIDQVAAAAKPHVNKVQKALEPHTRKAVRAYGKFLKSAATYHRQVQATVQETLKKHELTRPLATKGLEWFAASALLALPIIILARVFSAIFCKKVKKPARSGNTHHVRRRHNRGHPDK